jgi:hypothetical protein
MERERASPSLHDRLVIAAHRAAEVQEHSSDLVDQQRSLVTAVRETVAAIHRRRRDADRH